MRKHIFLFSGVMLELLKNAGFEVIIATDSGKELKTGNLGVYTYNNIITSGTCPLLAKTDKATDRTEELANKFIEILN